MRSASDNSGTRYEEHEAPKLEHFGGPKGQPARTLNLALILDGVARLAILVRPSSIREVPAIVQCHDFMQEKKKHIFPIASTIKFAFTAPLKARCAITCLRCLGSH